MYTRDAPRARDRLPNVLTRRVTQARPLAARSCNDEAQERRPHTHRGLTRDTGESIVAIGSNTARIEFALHANGFQSI